MAKKTSPQRAVKAQSLPQKGIAIEEALRVYFSGLGYFALRAIPYRLDGSDVTDIDLWLYERPATVSRRRIIVDIRHKKSPQAAERLIWAKGLQSALGVEAAFVATTDRRPSTQRLARSLKVSLIEDVPFQKLIRAFDRQDILLSQADLDAAVRDADAARHSTEWKDAMAAVKASLLTSLGFQSANRCLGVLADMYNDVVVSPPMSTRAMTGCRISYLAAACAAISLDYAMSDYIFKERNEREAALENGIRYGSAEASSALNRIRTASSLVERYLANGRALAKSLENSFMADAESIPSSIIAEYVSRQSLQEALFDPARDLLDASLARQVTPFDKLSSRAKALMGIFIDFSGGQRDTFAKMWMKAQESQSNGGELPFGR